MINNIDNNIGNEQKLAFIDQLDQQIIKKQNELKQLNFECEQVKGQINGKMKELNDKLIKVNQRECEINLLKKDLDSKLNDVENKLKETHKLTYELRENQDNLFKNFK